MTHAPCTLTFEYVIIIMSSWNDLPVDEEEQLYFLIFKA